MLKIIEVKSLEQGITHPNVEFYEFFLEKKDVRFADSIIGITDGGTPDTLFVQSVEQYEIDWTGTTFQDYRKKEFREFF